MKFSINRDRLAQHFTNLCEIDSPSRTEAGVASYLKSCFKELGADEIIEDDSMEKTGSNSNNIIIRFNGTGSNQEGVFFSCHMDTVQPGVGIKVKREDDVFYSAGDTILGSDDKSGIASLIELICLLKENDLPHCPIELVFTTCEEIGLIGAKNFDTSLLHAKMGYALDSTGINNIIVAAPAANKLRITIKGMAAHAGFNPEDGINALKIAALAINEVPLGRLDYETTSNFGLMKAGIAQNIVPALVTIEGEVRSHDQEKLKYYTDLIADKFQEVIENFPDQRPELGVPSAELEIINDYPAMNLKKSDPVIQRILKASEIAGHEQNMVIGGGGSDANIFNGFGLPTAILACGMNKVHTIDEFCDLNDLVTITELLFSTVIDQ